MPKRPAIFYPVRIGAMLLLAALAVVVWRDQPSWTDRFHAQVFDRYQQLSPRKRISHPVTIVAIDEKSLTTLGQWPWPRNLMAKIVDRIMAANPAALGIDLIFSEPDRYSPGNMNQFADQIPSDLMKRLSHLPSNDETFQKSLRGHPVILGFAGMENGGYAKSGGYTPFIVKGVQKNLPSDYLRRFAGALHSIEPLDKASAGRGFLSADLEMGVVRRIPLVATVEGVLVPSFDLELLRLATGTSAFQLDTDRSGAVAVGVGELRIPVSSNGRVWVHFSRHDPDRFVPALDLLEGRISAERLENRFVLLAVTGIGMVDYPTSPLGEYIPGVEVHAQLLESVFDNSLLTRPANASRLETALLFMLGGIFIVFIPGMRPSPAIAVGSGLIAAAAFTGYLLYTYGLLFDFVTPSAGGGLILALLLWDGFKQAEKGRRDVSRQLALEKIQAARLAGEMESARRIQLGLLPATDGVIPEDVPFDLYAHMEPAREVGGDLYDFFILSGERLYLIVGDVSGKGLPASLFMAVSKVLCKSIARQQFASLGEMLTSANRLLAEENRELLFLTAFVGMVDIRSGTLVYANAGHDYPYVVNSLTGKIRKLLGSSGPPICVVDEFSFESFTDCLAPGESLIVYTDGITEALDDGGGLFGHERLQKIIGSHTGETAARTLGEAILNGVMEFSGSTPQADDITLLVLSRAAARAAPS